MTTPDDLAAQKAAARSRARAARCALEPTTCATHAQTAARLLLALPELQNAQVVMAYAANAEELDPSPAVDALRERAVTIGMPRIEAPGILSAHRVDSDVDLEAGPLGIRQPSVDTARVAFDSIDVVIVPGVAFDENGCRLGYGGGYYDRLLPQLREDCVLIGYAYDEQVVSQLPRAEHDHLMTLVVTPSRVIRP